MNSIFVLRALEAHKLLQALCLCYRNAAKKPAIRTNRSDDEVVKDQVAGIKRTLADTESVIPLKHDGFFIRRESIEVTNDGSTWCSVCVGVLWYCSVF